MAITQTTIYGDYTIYAIDKNKIGLGFQGSVSIKTRYASGIKKGQLTGQSRVIYGPSRFVTDLDRVTDYLVAWSRDHKNGQLEDGRLSWSSVRALQA